MSVILVPATKFISSNQTYNVSTEWAWDIEGEFFDIDYVNPVTCYAVLIRPYIESAPKLSDPSQLIVKFTYVSEKLTRIEIMYIGSGSSVTVFSTTMANFHIHTDFKRLRLTYKDGLLNVHLNTLQKVTAAVNIYGLFLNQACYIGYYLETGIYTEAGSSGGGL